MSIEKVRAYFKTLGIDGRIQELDASSATVELAAQARERDEPVTWLQLLALAGVYGGSTSHGQGQSAVYVRCYALDATAFGYLTNDGHKAFGSAGAVEGGRGSRYIPMCSIASLHSEAETFQLGKHLLGHGCGGTIYFGFFLKE